MHVKTNATDKFAMQPTIICVRGPSGSGKTHLIEAMAPLLAREGLRVAVLKRSHHLLDLAGKDSDRLVSAGVAAALVHDAGGAALFRQPEASLTTLVGLLPDDIDLALVETFRPERYPVLLAAGEEPATGETLLGRFVPAIAAPEAEALAARLMALTRARSRAAAPAPARKVHRCAGAVLGRRLAAYGAALLGIEIPRTDHRLYVLCENDGCAADALISSTGCHPGNRTIRFTYEGKLAATFVDTESRQAVRVHAWGDLRDRAAELYPDADRHTGQMLAYEALAETELFGHRTVELPPVPVRRPGHARCVRCEEEIDGDAAIKAGEAAICRPCHAAARADHTQESRELTQEEEAR